MKKLVSLIIPIFVLTGCRGREQKEITHNYHEIKSKLIDWFDVFEQEEHNYIIYFYSENCGHCNSIKNEVISYYLETTENMYFVCTDLDVVFGSGNVIGINNIDDFFILGTPFLVKILEYVVSEYYAGTNAILEFINN